MKLDKGKQEGRNLALEHEALTERIIGAAIEVHLGSSGRVFSNQFTRRPSSSSLLLNFAKTTLEPKRVIAS